LDAGESEALILAQGIGAKAIILDEKAGWREALALGLNVTGTVGVVLLAKERGHIPLVKPVLDALLRAGFRLSVTTYQIALNQAGE
jgi:predicted nucleic acid-binding protein